jgi:Flp pilus assembly protein TadD
MAGEKKPQVFLGYAGEDLKIVRKVYKGLVKRGLNVWFDKENLGPGKWKLQIEKAIRRSRYFIICLSHAAIGKTGDPPGFQDQKLRESYEIASRQPEQKLTIVPVRLEDCSRGRHRLTLFQQYDLFEGFDEGLDELVVNLRGVSSGNPAATRGRTGENTPGAGLLARATTEFYAGRLRQAVTLYDSVLDSSPDNEIAWIDKGLVLEELGNYKEAIKAYDQALKIDCANAEACYHKGFVLGVLGKYDEAIKAFDQALKINPEHAAVWRYKGYALGILGNYGEAIKAFNRALEIKPGLAYAWTGEGLALWGLGKHAEALNACDHALKINPDDPEALKLKGKLMMQIHAPG